MTSSPVSFAASPVVDLVDLPWSTYAELEHVYRLIYEKDDEVCNLKEARDSLVAWSLVSKKTAYRPEIAAITAFVNAALRDKQQHDELDLISLYSAALIKFCEVLRNYEFNAEKNRIIRITFIKTGNNRSELAESLGLPGWVVDMRHDAAHGDRMSLDLMRKATFLAMDWLSANFWPILLQAKRIDRRVDGIVEHVFSDAPAVEKAAKKDFSLLMRQSAYSTVRFTVRTLLRLTAGEDLTLHQVNPKAAALVEVIVNMGQTHLLLHNLIDHFDSDSNEIRAAAILWFAEIIRGMTTKTALLSQQLSRYSTTESVLIPELEIGFMKVLHRLLMFPSDVTLAYVPHFKKIIPGKAETIDHMRDAMATLLGVGLRKETVGKDFQPKTIDDVRSGPQSGPENSTADKLNANKRQKKC